MGMGGGGHAPDPYRSANPVPGISPNGGSGGPQLTNPQKMMSIIFPNSSAFGAQHYAQAPGQQPYTQAPNPGLGFGNEQQQPMPPPLYGQPNPMAGLPSQGMGMNPYRPVNDPYAQQHVPPPIVPPGGHPSYPNYWKLR